MQFEGIELILTLEMEMTSDPSQKLPVTVLTGFLGSGKTTVLNELLGDSELKRTLVLVNEYGEVGLDHHLVSFSEDDVVLDMSSGCLCCTIRGDLAKILRQAPGRFARGGERWFDRVIIETTGLAEPGPILHTLMTDKGVASRYRLDGVITTVDAVNGDATLDRQAESLKQIAMADRLLLTKTDLADAETLDRLQKRLRIVNPAAPQLIATTGTIDPTFIFNAGLYDPTSKSAEAQNWLRAEVYKPSSDADDNDTFRHDEDIKTFCLTIDEPIGQEVFEAWLEMLLLFRGEDCLRIKGIINVAELEGPMVVHGVQHIFHPPVELEDWPDEDHRSRIVFITRNINESLLKNMLHLFTESSPNQTVTRLISNGDNTIANAGVSP